MLTYDDFEAGRSLGQAEFPLDGAVLDRWRRLFPNDELDGLMPHGMVAVVSMRAFFEVVPERPPGNIHAAQLFDMLRLPRSGETLTTRVSCLAKEIRRERKRVTFATDTAGSRKQRRNEPERLADQSRRNTMQQGGGFCEQRERQLGTTAFGCIDDRAGGTRDIDRKER